MYLLGLTGSNLLFVGIVLFINGLWLLGKVSKKEIIFINFFVGLLSFFFALYFIFKHPQGILSIKAGTLVMLFSCTYLWVSFNQWIEADGKGLGYYCLFVALTALPITLSLLNHASSFWDKWWALCWVFWSILWFVYFLNLNFSLVKNEKVGWFTIFTSIVTAWIPGYLLINGYFN